MKCSDINDLLPDYLDKKLTPEQGSKIEAHVAGCPACRQELEEIQSVRERLRGAFMAEEIHIEPPPSAWDKLRRRLEPDPSTPLKHHGRFYIPVWQTATATALVAVLVVGVLWGTGTFSQDGRFGAKNTPTAGTMIPGNPVLPPMIAINTLPDSTSPYGSNVQLTLSLTNPTADTFTLAAFPPQVNIVPDNNPKVPVRTFAAGSGNTTLSPGQSDTFNVTWDQKDNSGQQVPAGWYDVYVLADGGTTSTQQIQGEATRVYVLPPEGVLQTTVTVNQTVTVNGFAITLEKIEFSDQQMIVYASSGLLPTTAPATLVPPPVTLPPNTLTPPAITYTVTATAVGTITPPIMPPSSGIVSGTGGGIVNSSSAVATPPLLPPTINFALADYSIDGGSIEQAGFSSSTAAGGTLEQIWSNLHPVSKNAKQIIFTITSLGSLQGPWVFVINLG